MKRLTVALLALTLSVTPPRGPHAGEFTSADLLSASFDRECLDYCIIGLCFWLTCGLTGCSVVTTPKVKHRWPDLVVQANAQPGDMAWTELRETLGTASYTGASALTMALAGAPAGGGDLVTDTAQRSDGVRYHDTSVIGSPMALITRSAVSAAELRTTLTALANQEEGYLSGITPPSPTAVAAAVSPEIATALNAASSVADIANTVNSFVTTLEGLQTLSELGSAGIGFGFDIGSAFCPSQARPFLPYYLSELDVIGWRMGIPDRFAPESLIPGATAIGNWPLNTWGSVYPRTGFVTQTDPTKAAAVAAQRAIDITTSPAAPHVYIPFGYSGEREVTFGQRGLDQTECLLGGGRWEIDGENDGNCHPRRSVQWLPASNAATDVWQMVSPVTGQCDHFGSADPSWSHGKQSTDHRYAWNYWRQYQCCLEGPGAFLYSISIPSVCF